MTAEEIEGHNLYLAGKAHGVLMTCDPAVMDRIAVERAQEGQVRNSFRQTAVLLRILRGDPYTDATAAVTEFIGKVGNFLQVFEGGDSPLCGSKMYEEMKTSLNEVRALFSTELQPFVKVDDRPEQPEEAGA